MKKAKMYRRRVDHISTLPDHILRLILSRLHSTEEVVRMSVLSTRWKYLWTSIPSLDIDISRNPKPMSELKRNEFIQFVYLVLLETCQTTIDLNSFTLDCANYYDTSTIWRWIHAVVKRKVKTVDLKFSLRNQNETIVLPHCLVDCGSLEMLSLNFSLHSLSLKIFTGSKTLKVLRLDSVNLLDPDLVQSFFVNCPLLEELSLLDCLTHNLDYLSILCPNLKTLRIAKRGVDYNYAGRFEQCEKAKCERLTVISPKLVCFEYGGHMANHFSFDIKSLKKAVIELEDKHGDNNFGFRMCELFAQVSHVEYLSINNFFLRTISFKCECCYPPKKGFPESFPNLKKLELKFEPMFMAVLLRILRCSSNLKSLHFIILNEIYSSFEFKRKFEGLGEDGTRTLTRHLKRVEFSDFKGDSSILDVARFLLKHGNALEEIVFSWSKRDKFRKQIMEAMDKVSNFYKASSSVKVITLKNE